MAHINQFVSSVRIEVRFVTSRLASSEDRDLYKMLSPEQKRCSGSEFFHTGSWIQGQNDSESQIWIRIKEFK
jgi:hypothetical protein